MSVEILLHNPEFEQNKHHEVERTFLPVFPELLTAEYRELSRPVEQYYLSHPSENFSLRCREEFDDNGNARYTAALKDRGTQKADGVSRLEVETEITADIYEHFRTPDRPLLRKLRAHPNRNVAIDFFEDGSVHVESEHPIAWTSFADTSRMKFIDVTGDSQVRSEWKAHFAYMKHHGGQEALAPLPELDVQTIATDILATRRHDQAHFVQIAGRSGSGKSTVVRELRTKLAEYGLSSDVISTDDYHRGNTWLHERTGGEPWIDWDDPIVYDTARMADDLARLADGERIARREVDFGIVETRIVGEIRPVDIMIIEGIYAGSQDLAAFADSKYEMPTPLATCIGRRLLRDLRERPEFADPAKSLRYMLEYAEPRYQEQNSR